MKSLLYLGKASSWWRVWTIWLSANVTCFFMLRKTATTRLSVLCTAAAVERKLQFSTYPSSSLGSVQVIKVRGCLILLIDSRASRCGFSHDTNWEDKLYWVVLSHLGTFPTGTKNLLRNKKKACVISQVPKWTLKHVFCCIHSSCSYWQLEDTTIMTHLQYPQSSLCVKKKLIVTQWKRWPCRAACLTVFVTDYRLK